MPLAGQMRHEEIGEPVPINVPFSYTHITLWLTSGVERQSTQHTLFHKSTILRVNPGPIGSSIISDKDVNPTIAVQIGTQDSQPWPRRLAESGLIRSIFKTKPFAAILSAIVVQPGGDTWK